MQYICTDLHRSKLKHTLDTDANLEHERGEQETSTTCFSYCHSTDGVEDVSAKEVAKCPGRSLFVHLLFLWLAYGKACVGASLVVPIFAN
jgi:hypothetical protein